MTDRIKNALNLVSKGKRTMSIATFGAAKGSRKTCELVEIGIEVCSGPALRLRAFAVPTICEPLASSSLELSIDHLSHLKLADPPDGSSNGREIDILVGSDYYWSLVTGRIQRGQSGPVAIETKVGWVLSGPATLVGGQDHPTTLVTHTLHVNCLKRLESQLRSFWDIESLGIVKEGDVVLDNFEERIVFQEGRYEVPLPWKTSQPDLPDNYQLCYRRLMSLLRRLRQNPEIMREYDLVIRDQINKGIVEVVSKPDQLDGDKLHYLPHHAVIRQDKETTKLRIVYDASAKESDLSLNDCLHTGPKFDQSVLDILLRFRLYHTALVADIEKAFLMISVNKQDRDALRFLWVSDPEKEPPDIQVLRFARVVFGVVSSPFLLNVTIRHHIKRLQSVYPELTDCLLRSIYVDDVICGASSEDSAYKLFLESKEMLKLGGFNLRKFVTNSKEVQERINEKEGQSGLRDSVAEQLVLGVSWNVSTDEIIFKPREILNNLQEVEVTKRHVVHTVGKFFDPLGFLSPIMIRFKILFQELCEAKVDWDQTISGPLLDEWNTLVNSLRECCHIRVPRCYYTGNSSEVVSQCLYGFCDASKRAYVAVIYLVVQTSTHHFVRFVTSKTRVAPTQGQTIPRLELLSTLLLARLMKRVTLCLEKVITLDNPVYFSDSQIALHWISGKDKVWKQFVQNRVVEIRSLTSIDSWKHCAGEENPADIPSRGLLASRFHTNVLWLNGPTWLGARAGTSVHDLPTSEECLVELKRDNPERVHELLTVEGSSSISQIIDIKNYNSIQRLFKVTVYVLRFIKLLRKKPVEPLAQELSIVEIKWIRDAQNVLASERNFPQWKTQFRLFFDSDGIWRCGGRLANANAPYSTRFPILLPKNHRMTHLIVQHAHERVLHEGVKETLTQLRSKYWIVRGRSLVKQIIYRCTLCRRFEGAAYKGPPAPPLPSYRVQESPPFTHTGVDFAGPMYVRMSPSDKCTTKVWVCLFTCCTTRGVHIDIVPDLSTVTFFRCFKRFIARRGIPHLMISDNGKTFKAAARMISEIMSQGRAQDYLTDLGIEWRFNLERAPWWGGLFERLIKSMKRCLKKMIGKSKLSYEELLTAASEVEMIMNSRPLSYVSMDDLEEPLTPSHLMIGRRLLSLPEVASHDESRSCESTHSEMNKRMKHLNFTLEQFWTRWKREYLLELRECHRYGNTNGCGEEIKIGDIVVVHDSEKKRGFWKLGVVERVITGKDEKSRGAEVRVHKKGHRSTLLRRPVQRLYPIEASCHTTLPSATPDLEDVSLNPESSVVDDTVVCPESDRDEEHQVNESPPLRRSRRAAAQEAQDRIIACNEQL